MQATDATAQRFAEYRTVGTFAPPINDRRGASIGNLANMDRHWTDDPLDDFVRRDIELIGKRRHVHVSGAGPAIIVMAEMPGISPQVVRFGRWVRDAGFTVYLPSLFGRDGAVPGAEEGAAIFKRACVSAEFRALGGGRESPVADWLRALARLAHEECGGVGVGAIGMCFTGNFALNMMLEPAVLAPVLAQPALPLDEPARIESSPTQLALIAERLRREKLEVRAYRFEGDPFCRAERFAAYAAALGEPFKGKVIAQSAATGGPRPPFFEEHVPLPHSVVTVDLVEGPGEPTSAARDEIIQFFHDRLGLASKDPHRGSDERS